MSRMDGRRLVPALTPERGNCFLIEQVNQATCRAGPDDVLTR